MLHVEKIPVKDIKVSADRIRQTYKNIDKLAANIKKLGGGKEDRGLLQNITVLPDNTLLFGGRRLEAIKSLGWKNVSVVVADSVESIELLRQMEHDENTCREPLNAIESAAFANEKKAKLLAEREKAANEKAEAKKKEEEERIAKGLPAKKPTVSRKRNAADVVDQVVNGDPAKRSPDSGDQKPDTRVSATDGRERTTAHINHEAAEGSGHSHDTIAKVNKITEAAKADPEVYGDLPVKIADGTLTVNAATKELEARLLANGDRATVAEAFTKQINRLTREMDTMMREFEEMKPNACAYQIHIQSLVDTLKGIRRQLHVNRTNHVCPYCNNTLKHITKNTDCTVCKTTGHVGEVTYRSGCKTMGIPASEESE